MWRPGNPIIEADVNYVVRTERGTTLEKNGVNIQTSEHVLAALTGLEIDNVLIEIDASETPIMDGSSKFFVEALIDAGIEEQSKDRNEYVVKEIISYHDEESGSDITVLPADSYEVTAMVDFGTKILGTQNATMKNLNEIYGTAEDNLVNTNRYKGTTLKKNLETDLTNVEVLRVVNVMKQLTNDNNKGTALLYLNDYASNKDSKAISDNLFENPKDVNNPIYQKYKAHIGNEFNRKDIVKKALELKGVQKNVPGADALYDYIEFKQKFPKKYKGRRAYLSSEYDEY